MAAPRPLAVCFSMYFPSFFLPFFALSISTGQWNKIHLYVKSVLIFTNPFYIFTGHSKLLEDRASAIRNQLKQAASGLKWKIIKPGFVLAFNEAGALVNSMWTAKCVLKHDLHKINITVLMSVSTRAVGSSTSKNHGIQLKMRLLSQLILISISLFHFPCW